MVRWSKVARDDLKSIHDYISLDSRFYAKKVIREIIDIASTLEKVPERGRVVPELDDSKIREIFIYSYRIIYEISKSVIHILTIIHGKRNISEKDIPRK